MQTQLTRRSPVNGLLSSFFDDAFFAPLTRSSRASSEQTWLPAVDLSQTEDSFVLRADLPGLSRDDIEITVEDRTLTLTGTRSFESRDEDSEEREAGERYTRIERNFGTFTRSFHLPTNVDTTRIDARFADGVLTLSIAKSEQAKSRRIEIT